MRTETVQIVLIVAAVLVVAAMLFMGWRSTNSMADLLKNAMRSLLGV